MLKVAIVGAAGYTGAELLRLLIPHPQVQVVAATSREHAGLPVSQFFPQLRGQLDLAFCLPESDEVLGCDVVFFATPHGVAMQQAPRLLDQGIKVIDLGADFRIEDIPLWEQWYGMTHTSPEWVEQAVYGLPEVNQARIVDAQLVACPGCYPTSVQLGLLPLLAANVIDLDDIIIDAKSGVSGAAA